MREIKFRAWDKWQKKIVSVDGALFDIPSHLPSNWRVFLIPLQYTGLKDATKWEQLKPEEQEAWLAKGKSKEGWNGKEIYEGDILAPEPNAYNRHEVVFEYGAFQLVLATGSRQTLKDASWNGKVQEVIIGNIYDNPELMEVE